MQTLNWLVFQRLAKERQHRVPKLARLVDNRINNLEVILGLTNSAAAFPTARRRIELGNRQTSCQDKESVQLLSTFLNKWKTGRWLT
jgi:hypothetical protein